MYTQVKSNKLQVSLRLIWSEVLSLLLVTATLQWRKIYYKHRKHRECCSPSLFVEGSLWMMGLLFLIVRNFIILTDTRGHKLKGYPVTWVILCVMYKVLQLVGQQYVLKYKTNDVLQIYKSPQVPSSKCGFRLWSVSERRPQSMFVCVETWREKFFCQEED